MYVKEEQINIYLRFCANMGCILGKMRHHVDNDKHDGQIEGIPVDLDERTAKTATKMEDYVSIYVSMGTVWFCGCILYNSQVG